jgi:DNA-binding response OmpR family regulator
VGTVLLIEDEPGLRLIVRVNLNLAGIDVLEAEDGVTGIELARAGKPDVVVLDVRLPGLDGWDVARDLLGDSSTSNIPLIFLSAHTDTATRERGLQLGAIDFITKPFEVRDLVARVVQAMPREA